MLQLLLSGFFFARRSSDYHIETSGFTKCQRREWGLLSLKHTLCDSNRSLSWAIA